MSYPKIKAVESNVCDDNGHEWKIIGTMEDELSYYDDMGVFNVGLSVYKDGEWLGDSTRLCTGWIEHGGYYFDSNDRDERLWNGKDEEIYLHCHDVVSPIPDEIMWEMDEVSARVCEQMKNDVIEAWAKEE